jgi:hypothetical protein
MLLTQGIDGENSVLIQGIDGENSVPGIRSPSQKVPGWGKRKGSDPEECGDNGSNCRGVVLESGVAAVLGPGASKEVLNESSR